MEDDNGANGLSHADDATHAAQESAGAWTGGPDARRDDPLPVPRPETGEPRVDAALSLLDDLTELPVTEHPAVFERVHAQLGEVLGELRSGSGRDGS